MTTPDEIEALLKPYGLSLKERPKATKDSFAYEEHDRNIAWDMACIWQDEHIDYKSDVDVCTDFICHQSDVIELLCNTLKWANHFVDNIKFGRWKEVKGGYVTPGGTPYFVCAKCGCSGHLYGIEYPKRKTVCENCGTINLYPWEKEL